MSGLILKEINVYEYWGVACEPGAAGRLSCLCNSTPPTVSTTRKRPAVLILPGGGYEHTSARESEPIALQFVAKGYAAFVLHYSVAPFSFPTSLREAAMAMRYIRENAAEYEVNPNMVAAIGFSAGGHLCGTLGTMYDYPEVFDIGTSEQIRPDALGLCYPVAISWGKTNISSFMNLCKGDAALAERLSLDKLVRKDMPPVFLWHTRTDGAVSCKNSLALATALEEAHVPFTLHVYARGPHGLSTSNALAYPANKVPSVSWDVPGWIDALVLYFTELGFTILD